jgi:hypothetical protein
MLLIPDPPALRAQRARAGICRRPEPIHFVERDDPEPGDFLGRGRPPPEELLQRLELGASVLPAAIQGKHHENRASSNYPARETADELGPNPVDPHVESADG